MKRLISIFIAGGLTVSSAFVAEAFETKYDFGKQSYEVSGVIAEAAFNRLVTFKVLDKEDKMIHIATLNTDSQGNFCYVFDLDDISDSGYYTAEIGVYDGIKIDPCVFFYASERDKDNLLSLIKNAQSAQDLRGILEKDYNMDIIGIKKDDYERIGEEKVILYENIFKAIPSVNTLVNFQDKIEEEMAYASVRRANVENIDDIIIEYNEYFMLEECEMHKKIQSNMLGEIYKLMAGRKVENVEDIRKVFDECAVLVMLNSSAGWGEFEDILEENIKYLDIDEKEYNNCDKAKLAIKLCEKKYSNAEELSNDIKKFYDNSQKASSSGGGNSGGGGGSSISAGDSTAYYGFINKEKTSESVMFNDMDNYEWALPAVEALYKKNVIRGNGDGGYQPSEYVTREQFVKMLLLAFDIYVEGLASDFADVPEKHWAYPYISCAVESHIVSGFGDGLFGLEKLVTREDMAVLIGRASVVAGISINGESAKTLTDIHTVSEYAQDSVKKMIKCGIINGYEDGSFRPKNGATRAEAAVMIYNVMKGEKIS